LISVLVIQGNQWRNPRLRDTLAVHALPYRAVLEGQFAGVVPVSGCLNVLVTHGRIKGMQEEVNTLGLVLCQRCFYKLTGYYSV
jgi:hypothetical protein